MTPRLRAALEYRDYGWSIIPISPDTKRPAIKWRKYQDELPTEEELEAWFSADTAYELAVVTGEMSGIVIVDCDNPDALHAAFDAGMRSPIRVTTKRGTHLYFRHPRDGKRRGPRAGVNVRRSSPDWPRVDGLDFRGDGSYALLPPSRNYEWEIPPYHDFDDMPVWEDWQPKLEPARTHEEFDFSTLDLSEFKGINLDEITTEWDRTAQFVREKFPATLRIPTGAGNGRNERVMRHISDCVLQGHFGDELRVMGYAFMNEFFEQPLPEPEFQATVRSIEEAERRNHPERFDEEGRYIPPRAVLPSVAKDENGHDKPIGLIQMKDADRLMKEAGEVDYLIEPWLPASSIVQVNGYSGHGKSMFVQHAIGALCAGQKYYGPFEIGRPATVLYMDFEMGKGTIARRLHDLRECHGDTQDRMNIWAPFDGRDEIDLRSREGMLRLKYWIEMAEPDVVVIDTVRSAFPGFEENAAPEWARVNALATKLRNHGISVIYIHHTNKPGDSGLGREAGSSNQLTVLENQIRVVQVFEEEDMAKMKAGIWDQTYEKPVWPELRRLGGSDFRLNMVLEVRYGKVREWTDMHDPVQWIGFGEELSTGKTVIVSSRSTKQKAKDIALNGHTPEEVANLLHKPLRVIRDWLELDF